MFSELMLILTGIMCLCACEDKQEQELLLNKLKFFVFKMECTWNHQ